MMGEKKENPFSPFYKFNRKTWLWIVGVIILATIGQIILDRIRGVRVTPWERERRELGLLPADTTKVDSVYQRFFPIQTGNEWTYGTENRMIRVLVMGEKMIHNQKYYVLRTQDVSFGKITTYKDLKSITEWNYYRFDKNNDIMEFLPKDSSEVLKYSFSAIKPDGKSFSAGPDLQIEIERNDVRTGVGIFNPTFHFQFHPGRFDEREEWFASGIGLVKAIWKDDGIILLQAKVDKKLFFQIQPAKILYQ